MATQLSHEKPACDEPPSKRPRIETIEGQSPSPNMSETRRPLEAFFRTHGQTPKAEKAQARHEAQARFDARVKAEEQARNERRLQTAQKNEEAANIPDIAEPTPSPKTEVETVMSYVLRNIVNKWEKEFKLSNYVGKDQPPLPTEFRREGVIASQKSLVKEWQKKIDSYKKWDYDIMQKMIDKYLKLQARDKLLNDKIIRGKTSNIIALFASSQDEKVQTILTTAIKKADLFDWKHRDSQDFRREWDAAEGSETWKSKSERFLHEYWELYWDETVFKNGFNRLVQDTFIKNYAKDFVVNNNFKKDSMKICYFHNDTKLWGMGKGYAMSIILNYLRNNEWQYWKDKWEATLEKMPDDTEGQVLEKDDVEKKLRKLLLNFSGTGNWLNGIARTIHNNMIHDVNMHREIQFNLAPKTKKYFQFKNAAYNLKMGQLEHRTRDMYITASGILSYDYPQGETDADYQEEMDKINTIIAQIQPEPKFQEAVKRWRGYCLTGETKAKVFMMNVGETAENGKTTLSDMYILSFPIYGKNIDKNFLNKGNATGFNKAMASCANCPIRLCCLEEFGAQPIDVDRWKTVVDKPQIPVLPLYQEQINMHWQAKVETCANNDMNAGKTICRGILRRGRRTPFESLFVDSKDDVDEKNHRFLKNESLLDLFDNDRYKIALFRVFAPYAKKFYDEKRLKLPKECKNAFAEAMAENDEWAEFLDTHFEKTNNIDDILSKLEVMTPVLQADRVQEINTSTISAYNNEFKTLKKELKKRGHPYKSQLKKNGSNDHKGIFQYIKIKPAEEAKTSVV